MEEYVIGAEVMVNQRWRKIVEVGKTLSHLTENEHLLVKRKVLLLKVFQILSQTGVHFLQDQYWDRGALLKVQSQELHDVWMLQFGPHATLVQNDLHYNFLL
jgi:hypothetical protein